MGKDSSCPSVFYYNARLLCVDARPIHLGRPCSDVARWNGLATHLHYTECDQMPCRIRKLYMETIQNWVLAEITYRTSYPNLRKGKSLSLPIQSYPQRLAVHTTRLTSRKDTQY